MSLFLVVPYKEYIKSLQMEIDYYAENEQYEKAAEVRDKLNEFIKNGKDAEIEMHPTIINIDKKMTHLQ